MVINSKTVFYLQCTEAGSWTNRQKVTFYSAAVSSRMQKLFFFLHMEDKGDTVPPSHSIIYPASILHEYFTDCPWDYTADSRKNILSN